MDIHQKIRFKEYAYLYLEWNQYEQLIKGNLLSLAPYYNERLLRQAKIVDENERFKSIFGCYRSEYEQ